MSTVRDSAAVEQMFLPGVGQHDRIRRVGRVQANRPQQRRVGLGCGDSLRRQHPRIASRLLRCPAVTVDQADVRTLVETNHAADTNIAASGSRNTVASGERVLDELGCRVGFVARSTAVETSVRSCAIKPATTGHEMRHGQCCAHVGSISTIVQFGCRLKQKNPLPPAGRTGTGESRGRAGEWRPGLVRPLRPNMEACEIKYMSRKL